MGADYTTIEVERQGSVVWVWLNRPNSRNAMNRAMIAELLDLFTRLRADGGARVVVIGGRGPVFCAGGDLKEMRESLAESADEQLRQVRQFDAMLLAINHAPQVVIAQIHGAVLGGGVGLTAVTDVALAAEDAVIGWPEVARGLAPAIISPYVTARIGLSQARRFMLTGAQLTGREAAAVGLVHAAYPAAQLPEQVRAVVNQVLQAGPAALAACKALLFEVAEKGVTDSAESRVHLLHQLRHSPEGQEGMLAFLQKRPPYWVENI